MFMGEFHEGRNTRHLKTSCNLWLQTNHVITKFSTSRMKLGKPNQDLGKKNLRREHSLSWDMNKTSWWLRGAAGDFGGFCYPPSYLWSGTARGKRIRLWMPVFEMSLFDQGMMFLLCCAFFSTCMVSLCLKLWALLCVLGFHCFLCWVVTVCVCWVPLLCMSCNKILVQSL